MIVSSYECGCVVWCIDWCFVWAIRSYDHRCKLLTVWRVTSTPGGEIRRNSKTRGISVPVGIFYAWNWMRQQTELLTTWFFAGPMMLNFLSEISFTFNFGTVLPDSERCRLLPHTFQFRKEPSFVSRPQDHACSAQIQQATLQMCEPRSREGSLRRVEQRPCP